MKKSLNAWTVDGSLGMEAMFEAVSRAGFDGIELNVDRPGGAHALSMETTKEEFAGIRALSEKYSLPVVSISTSLSGGMSGIPERWGEYRRLLRKQIEIAKALGASGILTVPGGMGGDITLKTARENSIAFYRSVRDEIEESGIFVGLENVWNGFFLSPFDMTSMLEEIGSKHPHKGDIVNPLHNLRIVFPGQDCAQILHGQIDQRHPGRISEGKLWGFREKLAEDCRIVHRRAVAFMQSLGKGQQTLFEHDK